VPGDHEIDGEGDADPDTGIGEGTGDLGRRVTQCKAVGCGHCTDQHDGDQAGCAL
jgi:hypothetical protein